MEKPKTYGFKELPFSYVKSVHANPEEGSKFINIGGFDVHFRDEGRGAGYSGLTWNL